MKEEKKYLSPRVRIIDLKDKLMQGEGPAFGGNGSADSFDPRFEEEEEPTTVE